jgi:hypothetical protein
VRSYVQKESEKTRDRDSVSVQTAKRNCHRQRDLNNNFVLTVLKVGSLRPDCQQGWVLVRALLRLQIARFSLYFHIAEEAPWASCFVLFCFLTRTQFSFLRTPPSRANYLSKAPPPKTITMEALISIFDGGRTRI